MRLLKSACLFLFMTAMFGGCTHYNLAGESRVPFRTLYVEMVQNRSFAPQAQASLTNQLIDAFLRDGSVKIVSSVEQADAVLTVALIDYTRELDATSSSDTGRASSIELGLKASASLTKADGSPYFKERIYTSEEPVYTDDGQVRAEYQTMPVLTRDLAIAIKNSVVGVW